MTLEWKSISTDQDSENENKILSWIEYLTSAGKLTVCSVTINPAMIGETMPEN